MDDAAGSRFRRFRAAGLWGRLTRYTAGSVVATGISELVFVVAYWLGAAPAVASVLAFVGGAIPNYLLNRRWAWRNRGGRTTPRQVAGYVAVVLCSAGLAAVVTTLTDAWSKHAVHSHALQVALGGTAYFLTYAVLFLVKFALFDRVVFRHRVAEVPEPVPVPAD